MVLRARNFGYEKLYFFVKVCEPKLLYTSADLYMVSNIYLTESLDSQLSLLKNIEGNLVVNCCSVSVLFLLVKSWAIMG